MKLRPRKVSMTSLKHDILRLPRNPETKLRRKVEDDYIIGKTLGEGAFGTVRLCESKKDPTQQFACKTVPKSRLVTKDDIRNVKMEVDIMFEVRGHENIVNLFDVYEDEHNIHFVMEACRGGELFDRLVSKGVYAEKDAAAMLRVMLRTVNHCHQRSIAHRDIKPENFLFLDDSEDSRLMITDFGLSEIYQLGTPMTARVGTPFYVAPEVIRGSYDHKCDIFSVGCLLYIILSGMPPFYGETDQEILEATMKGEYDIDSDPWPSISVEAKEIVHKMLQKDPAKRPEALELLQHPWVKEDGIASTLPIADIVVAKMKRFRNMNKLKKRAFAIMAKNMDPDDMLELKAIFENIDSDHSGTITFEELRQGMKVVGKELTDHELDDIIKTYDVDGDGKIDINEFLAATMSATKAIKKENLLAIFESFDEDGNGFLTVEEVKKALEDTGVTIESCQSIIEEADKDGDGLIDYSEFCMLMLKDEEYDTHAWFSTFKF